MKRAPAISAIFVDTPGKIIELRSGVEGTVLSPAQRDALLAEVRGNPATTARLTLVAHTYLQGGATICTKFVRIRDGALRAAGRSFRNTPFLRDHQANDFMARGGTVVESDVVDLDGDVKAFRQTLELVKPWAIEAALDGTMDRFSVRFKGGPVSCTICGAEFRSSFFGGLYPSCDHEPGAQYPLKDGSTAMCLAEFYAATGVETSCCSVPSVGGTNVDEIRAAALAAAHAGELDLTHPQWAELSALINPHKEKLPMKVFATLAAVIGLAADVDEAAIVVGVEKVVTERDGLRAALSDTQTKLNAAVAERATAELATRETRRTGLLERALNEGRYIKGSNSEAHAVKLAARGDLDGLQAFIDDLPAGGAVPLRAGLRSVTEDPTPRVAPGAVVLNDDDKAAAKRMGVTLEAYLVQKLEALASVGIKQAPVTA